MCRICWSTGDSTVPCAGLNRGVWAGHRLEICTGKIHASHSSPSWKDVTSELVEEISAAFDLPIRTEKRKRVEDPESES